MNRIIPAAAPKRPRASLLKSDRLRLPFLLVACALLGYTLLAPHHLAGRDESTSVVILQQHRKLSRLSALRTAAEPSGNTAAGASAGAHSNSAALPAVEVWARGSSAQQRQQLKQQSNALAALLTGDEQQQLRQLCGRVLYHTLSSSVRVYGAGAHHAFVATGDIPDEWIRDSSVQLGVYLPRIAAHPSLRQVIEGAIRRQSSYILADPWANSFRETFAPAEQLSKFERHIGRGGWVATRNFEVDSGAYFISLLWNYYRASGLYAPERLLNETAVHDAVLAMINTWRIEQHHEEQSPYRYSELPRNGLGPPSGYTGMIWGGYRPSDDPQTYGYNIPANMYAAAALEKALELNAHIWRSPYINGPAQQLLADIRAGIEAYGVVPVGGAPGQKMYAYEVDGLGNAVHDFDDPNVPSLLSIPLLGYRHYDERVYRATRARLLSKANPYYFKSDKVAGCGSPHTPHGFIWPLGLMVQALTTSEAQEQANILRVLLRMQCGNGLMHESVSVDNFAACTRPVFEWSNAMLTTSVETLLGVDCDAEAQALHLQHVRQREQLPAQQQAGAEASVAAEPSSQLDLAGGVASKDDPVLFYERIDQTINTIM